MKKENSYSQILKSTSILGISQILVILIGIARTKVIALLLGPAGVGIIGIYQSVIDMIRTASGLGIDTSGIREIAANSDNKIVQGRTIYRLSWWFLMTALIGLILSIVFCYPISKWAFGDKSYAIPIASLSVCVFLAILTTGKSVILQGMRKISYMARSAVVGSFLSLLLTLPLYYWLGTKGIIPAFIVSSLVLYFCADYYYRKLGAITIKTSNKELFESGINTLKLGLYIVVAGIINTASMFLIRAYISRELDVDAAGLFQSAWTITNVYLGLILKSMGTDFFPRLSAVIEDKIKAKALVNEQSYIVLIIATPVIIAILLLSVFILTALYSSKFANANELLQWQIAGTFLKILSWPIAFIILAKNKGLIFLLSEALFYLVYLGASYLLFNRYGLEAIGIGYLIAYIIYLATIYLIGRSLSGFKWDKNIIAMIIVNSILIGITFFLSTQTVGFNKWIFGSLTFLASLSYSIFKLKKVFTYKDFKNWFTNK